MSGQFAGFFPNAPRAAKQAAKAREKNKSISSSPKVQPTLNGAKASASLRNNEFTDHPSADKSAAVDDNDSIMGDVLNGVGSASSHEGTVSSIFSAPQTSSAAPYYGNPNSLTPLTSNSSPPDRALSPPASKSNSHINTGGRSHDQNLEKGLSHLDSSKSKYTSPTIRPSMRQPGIKGEIRTYDPETDTRLPTREKRKAKPIYKEFGGLVCTHLGERHLSVVFMANSDYRKMTLPQWTPDWPRVRPYISVG